MKLCIQIAVIFTAFFVANTAIAQSTVTRLSDIEFAGISSVAHIDADQFLITLKSDSSLAFIYDAASDSVTKHLPAELPDRHMNTGIDFGLHDQQRSEFILFSDSGWLIRINREGEIIGENRIQTGTVNFGVIHGNQLWLSISGRIPARELKAGNPVEVARVFSMDDFRMINRIQLSAYQLGIEIDPEISSNSRISLYPFIIPLGNRRILSTVTGSASINLLDDSGNVISSFSESDIFFEAAEHRSHGSGIRIPAVQTGAEIKNGGVMFTNGNRYQNRPFNVSLLTIEDDRLISKTSEVEFEHVFSSIKVSTGVQYRLFYDSFPTQANYLILERLP